MSAPHRFKSGQGKWNFNAKCNLTKLTIKKSWLSSSGQQVLVVSAFEEHCIVNHLSVEVCSRLCGVSGWFVSIFCPFPLPFIPVFYCVCSVTGVWMTWRGSS